MRKNYTNSHIPWYGENRLKMLLSIPLLFLGLFTFAQPYCAVSTTYSGDYTSAILSTGALTNPSYTASSQPLGSYSDQTSQSFTTFPTQQISFSHTYVGGSNGVKIWVDWNNDFDFDDLGEEIYYLANASATKTATFIVPAAPAGSYRLRIRSLYGLSANPVACGEVLYGSTIDFTMTIVSVPSSPVLTQAAGVPSCSMGSAITATGTPDPGIAWYWQTSATGTSTAVPYAGPLTVSTNGTYYLRANDPLLPYWADASSIVISNFPLAVAPPSPVADVNPSCAPVGSILTVPAPAAGYIYYWQGTNMGGTSNATNASNPYTATATGTYYVAAYETATQCWSNTVGLPVTVGTVIPSIPIVAQTDFNFCVGAPSVEITAISTPPSSSLTTVLSQGNGCTGGAMVDINTNALPITLTSIDVVSTVGGTYNVSIYYKTGTYVGFDGNAAAWTLLGTFPATGPSGTPVNVDITDFTIPAGTTYGIFLNYEASYTDLATTYSNADMSISTGIGLCGLFSGSNIGRTFNGTFYYNTGIAGDLEWYSALTGNNNIGSGSPLETLGTTVLPNSSVAGVYEFYASSYLNGCYSSRALITVNLGNVNVVLSPIAATCNNGNDGAVVVSSVICGTAPFTYSIDGGTFGPQTGMTPGSHTVILKDANNDVSGTYTVIIPNAPAPSAVVMGAVTATNANISWTATGSETQWNIEWGAPGFTPGTGTEIGSGTSSVTNYLITPLNPSTLYDVYVSANCGIGTITGNWTPIVTITTSCAPITALPWTENFDNMSAIGEGIFPLCWVDENPFYWGSANNAVTTYDADALSGPNFISVSYSANSTIWTPEFNLIAGTPYEFSFNWAGDGGEGWDGAVYVNGSQSMVGATQIGANFVTFGDVTNSTYKKETFCFTPTATGIYSFGVKVEEVDYEWYLSFDDFGMKQVINVPSTDGALSTCQTDGVDLNTVITTTVTDGTWNFGSNPNAVNAAGMLNAAVVPAGIHEFYYISAGCAPDTTIATITIVAASSAGNDGALAVCRNQPFNLLSGLTGIVTFGGVWTNPNAVVVPNGNAIASNIPGQYNYKYIVTNGVCPNDTAKVVVNVQGCDYLGIDDLAFEGFSMYPNPTSNIVFISNNGSAEVFNYEVLDMNGRIILKANNAINGSTTTELDLSKVEVGVYMVRVFNENADKTFRVVKN